MDSFMQSQIARPGYFVENCASCNPVPVDITFHFKRWFMNSSFPDLPGTTYSKESDTGNFDKIPSRRSN